MDVHFLDPDPSFRSNIEEFLELWNNEEDFISAYTSGSTGTPKEIRLQKKRMIASAKATLEFLGIKEGDSALLCLPADKVGGMMMIVRSIVGKLKLYAVAPSSSPIKNIGFHIDFAAMVPMQLENSFEELKHNQIDKLIVGGAPMPSELNEKCSILTTSVYQTYGMTETYSHVAMRKCGSTQNLYEALPGVSFSELGGKLVIRAPHIEVENLVTNDEVELNSPTRFRWLGRSDFTINSGGIKIHPEEIERRLSRAISAPFFVFGEQDSQLGESLTLCIEGPKFEVRKKQLEALVPRYKCPKKIYWINEFVRTNEKIDRKRTRELTEHAIEQVL